MELINRIALLVKPKRRFVEWVNQLPEAEEPLREDELASLRAIYLLAVEDPAPDLQELIDGYWTEIFSEELAGWAIDESLWPSNRTAHTFRDWFHVETVDRVADADPHEPVTMSEVARTRCGMCDQLLDEHQVAIVLRGETCERWTFEQLDAWERVQATPEDEADDPLADVLFRCCGDECATRAETAIAEATTPRKET